MILKSSELKKITLFLIEHEVIFHPLISPKGVPDFSFYNNDKKYILILDRNIFVLMLRLAKTGTLKDKFSLKLISSLIFWSEYNGVTMTAGMAIMEYAYFKKDNKKPNVEKNIFLELFNQFKPSNWLNLATEKTNFITPIISNSNSTNEFFIENDHFKMHYLEMLKISQLYFDTDISIENKFKLFFEWNYNHTLICKYTIFYTLFVFGKKSKIFKNIKLDYNKIINVCINQAWDLTYLSFWSTLYNNESEEVFLFTTMDKELKELFKTTYSEDLEVFIKTFGLKVGNNIISHINNILKPRKNPEINFEKLNKIKLEEEQKLLHLTTYKKNVGFED